MNERHDDLQEIIDAALREMAAEEGDGFDPQACNLAEFCRRTGLTRSRARTVRAHGFRALPHGNSGRRAAPGVLAGHTGLVDDLLRKGVTNSQVIFERLLGQGYAGGLTTVKTYIAAHRDLVPAKRRQAAPQGCRGQRFRTAPGEAYQMDWGFVAVERPGGERARIACFAMVCHHCGGAHVEFFPNARQENLLIGMLHAFSALGVPATVLTDNMKSVVVRRDADGRPVWQADYAEFMGVVGFRTRLCRPRHPYTKGKVERLVRFVKGNFLAGRSFTDLDALNREAALWCAEQGGLATLMWTVPGGAQETGGPYMRDPRHPRHFTDEFKRQIVDLYNAGKPKREIMDEYDLGKSTVERWIKLINATGSPRAACNRTPEQNRILELERENRRLRMEVDVLKQAALIYARK